MENQKIKVLVRKSVEARTYYYDASRKIRLLKIGAAASVFWAWTISYLAGFLWRPSIRVAAGHFERCRTASCRRQTDVVTAAAAPSRHRHCRRRRRHHHHHHSSTNRTAPPIALCVCHGWFSLFFPFHFLLSSAVGCTPFELLVS